MLLFVSLPLVLYSNIPPFNHRICTSLYASWSILCVLVSLRRILSHPLPTMCYFTIFSLLTPYTSLSPCIPFSFDMRYSAVFCPRHFPFTVFLPFPLFFHVLLCSILPFSMLSASLLLHSSLPLSSTTCYFTLCFFYASQFLSPFL